MSQEGRRYPTYPRVGVGAVVLRDGKVLLVKRGQPPRQGLWTFPGGLVDLGESIFDAAQRELLEETGVVGEPVDVVDVFEIIDRDEEGRVRYHYVIAEVLLRYVRGEPRAGDDAADVRWVPVNALGAPEIGSGVERVVRRALKCEEEG